MNRLLAQLGSDPAPFYSAESARMTRVQRNFVVIEYVEIAIIVMAAFMAVTQKGRPGTMGIALGLLCNAALLLSSTWWPNAGAPYTSAPLMRSRPGALSQESVNCTS